MTKLDSKQRGHRFIASNMERLPAGEYTDAAIMGLQLRVREGARKVSRTWLFRYKWRSEWVRITLGQFPATGLADARERVASYRKWVAEGIDPRRAIQRRTPLAALPAQQEPGALPAKPVHDRHSIEFLCSEFMTRHVRHRQKRPEYTEGILSRDVLPVWKGRDVRSIKPRDVIELLDGIVERGSLVMANHTAGVLGQLFKFGIHRAILDTSPVILLYKPGGKEIPRDRALTDDELSILFKEGDDLTKTPALRHAITILLLTGQRRGELGAAQWKHIDFRAKTWVIPPENAKTGKGHTVPLSEWACAEFHALQALAGKFAYIMPDTTGKAPADPKLMTRGLARHAQRFEKLGIAPFVLHDLRRTCRTGLARLKIAPHIAERVLNHAQERIPGTYDTHDYMDEKRDALSKWAEHLEGLRP